MLHPKNFEIQNFKFPHDTLTFLIAVPFGGKCTKLENSTVVQLVLVIDNKLQGTIHMIVVHICCSAGLQADGNRLWWHGRREQMRMKGRLRLRRHPSLEEEAALPPNRHQANSSRPSTATAAHQPAQVKTIT